jgi:hypothetical protein
MQVKNDRDVQDRKMNRMSNPVPGSKLKVTGCLKEIPHSLKRILPKRKRVPL